MKITKEFLLKLKDWILELKDGEDYRLPDFLKDEDGARLLIQTFCEKLKNHQGKMLWSGHFIEIAEDEAIKEYLPENETL